jgi:hypothetical protein
MHAQLLILGAGYTGRYLMTEATRQGTITLSSSRDPERHLAHIPLPQRLTFNLAQPDTWEHIPTDCDLMWCFPAAPLEQVQAFAEHLGAPTRRLVVLGSTSAYDVPDQVSESLPPIIDESSPIDLRKPRVQGEEYLRKKHGAIILRVAGIYGPGRNPLDWIRSGRVGPSGKYVNLIHVEDLASICLLALAKGRPGEIYNVSDGTPRTWADICRIAHDRWGVTATAKKDERSPGKRLDISKLIRELPVRLQHPDLFTALEAIELNKSKAVQKDQLASPTLAPARQDTPSPEGRSEAHDVTNK